jgi:predicted Fe-Mo cluster-binding NifX family protein
MRTQTTDDQDTLRFRAPSLEEAVALAEQSLGTRVRVVAANRIRRGGVGGFFAADLGVEVIVAPASETVEDALERLINDSADEERTQWTTERSAEPIFERGGAPSDRAAATTQDGFDMPGRRWLLDQADTLPAATSEAIQAALAGERQPRRAPVTPVDPSDPTTNTSSWWEPPASDSDRTANTFADLVARLAAEEEPERVPRQVDVIDLLAALAGSRDSVEFDDPTPTTEVPVIAVPNDVAVAPVAPVAPTAESPGLIRVEKIIEELQALTASPRLLAAMKQRQAVPVEPVPVESVPVESVPTVEPVVDSSAAAVVAPKGALLGTPRALVPPVDVASEMAPADQAAAEMTIDVVADVDQSMFDEPMGSGPSQRQVELAVAAADQLIESLTRDDTVKRLSVRIVLRTAGNDEVEAGAEWESNG